LTGKKEAIVHSNDQRIAALITCHNRKEKTLACLDALKNQKAIEHVNLRVFLVDAGSTDGTADAVRKSFPEVNLIPRDDSLFWCGGMRVAYEEAVKEGYDYYLWLNEDTNLLDHAVSILLATSDEVRAWEDRDCIIVGSTRDPQTGKHTYGGVIRASKYRPIKFNPVIPSAKPQKCDTMNGNCVLVPRSVAASLGNLSREYTHRMADTDYGLRAKNKGISIWLAAGYVGTCKRNPLAPWLDPNVPLQQRLKMMKSPKGMPPREWVFFAKRHAGIRWPIHLLGLYLRTVFPKKQGTTERKEQEVSYSDPE
jgi:GT2 family glycosyltransferase